MSRSETRPERGREGLSGRGGGRTPSEGRPRGDSFAGSAQFSIASPAHVLSRLSRGPWLGALGLGTLKGHQGGPAHRPRGGRREPGPAPGSLCGQRVGGAPRGSGPLVLGGSLFLQPLFFYFLFFFNIYLFLRLRQRQSMSGGGAGREGDTGSETGSRLRAVSTEPDAGLEPTDHEIMT